MNSQNGNGIPEGPIAEAAADPKHEDVNSDSAEEVINMTGVSHQTPTDDVSNQQVNIFSNEISFGRCLSLLYKI